MDHTELTRRIEEIVRIAGDGLTRKEFTDAFDLVLKAVVQARKDLSQAAKAEIVEALKAVERAKVQLEADGRQELGKLRSPIEKALRDQERGMNFIYDKVRGLRSGKDGRNGTDGRDGRDGKDGRNGTDGSPDTAEEVRDKLETLVGEERLDASAIKNLPELVETTGRAVLPTAFWNLTDVDVAGVAAGQSIQWDGVRWIAYTPAGSGGTPIWGEDLTDQGPGTSFTLAHTPLSGTVRLFRGGAYQSATNGDYSITGATITLANALADGEVLVADYSYS